MTYIEWRDQLKESLSGAPEAEQKRVLDYYSESYADRREAGFSEEEIIESFGNPYDAAQKILGYSDGTSEAPERIAKSKEGKYTVATYTAANYVNELSVDLGAYEVICEFFGGDRAEVSYPEHKAVKVEIDEKCGKLKIDVKIRKRYCIGFRLNSLPPIVVRLPQGSVIDLEADVRAGHMEMADGNYKNVELDVGAGEVSCGKANIQKLDVDASAGSVKFDGLDCREAKIDARAGSVKLLEADIGKLSLVMKAGSVKISKLTCPSVNAHVTAGSLKMDLTGDESEYSVFTSCMAGGCNIKSHPGTTEKTITAECVAGSMSVKFNA